MIHTRGIYSAILYFTHTVHAHVIHTYIARAYIYYLKKVVTLYYCYVRNSKILLR